MRRSQTDLIVVHCAATDPDQDIGAAEIDAWHRQRGFDRIGYHFVIRRNGFVEPGRDITEVGAHAKGYNWKSVGICLVGGGRQEPVGDYTPAQWDSLRGLVVELKKVYPEAEVLGHRDLPDVKKACPVFDVRSWWARHQERSQQPSG